MMCIRIFFYIVHKNIFMGQCLVGATAIGIPNILLHYLNKNNIILISILYMYTLFLENNYILKYC